MRYVSWRPPGHFKHTKLTLTQSVEAVIEGYDNSDFRKFEEVAGLIGRLMAELSDDAVLRVLDLEGRDAEVLCIPAVETP